jgi:hypothetical protein
MRRRLLIGLLLLLVAPGCRTLAGVATFVGGVAIEAAFSDDDWGGDDDCEPERRRDRRAATPNPSRRASADPSR